MKMAMLMTVLVGMIMLVTMLVMVLMLMVMVVVMIMIVAVIFHDHIEFHGAKVGSHHARCTQFVSFHSQLAELRFQVVQIEAKIQKRANRHVAADAGKAIEVKSLHARGMVPRRSGRRRSPKLRVKAC